MHTPQAFLETSSQAGHVLLQHRELHALLFSNSVWVLQRPTLDFWVMSNSRPPAWQPDATPTEPRVLGRNTDPQTNHRSPVNWLNSDPLLTHLLTLSELTGKSNKKCSDTRWSISDAIKIICKWSISLVQIKCEFCSTSTLHSCPKNYVSDKKNHSVQTSLLFYDTFKE